MPAACVSATPCSTTPSTACWRGDCATNFTRRARAVLETQPQTAELLDQLTYHADETEDFVGALAYLSKSVQLAKRTSSLKTIRALYDRAQKLKNKAGANAVPAWAAVTDRKPRRASAIRRPRGISQSARVRGRARGAHRRPPQRGSGARAFGAAMLDERRTRRRPRTCARRARHCRKTEAERKVSHCVRWLNRISQTSNTRAATSTARLRSTKKSSRRWRASTRRRRSAA